MKNILSYAIFLSASVISITAFADFTPFTTVSQAELYCPPQTGLTFVATNPKIPNGAGTISGNFNAVSFNNASPTQAPAPLATDPNGVIQNVAFRQANNMYGYNSNHVISCFYAYTSFTNGVVSLVMRQN